VPKAKKNENNRSQLPALASSIGSVSPCLKI